MITDDDPVYLEMLETLKKNYMLITRDMVYTMEWM